MVGSFIKDSRALYVKEDNLFSHAGEHLAAISEQEETINQLSEDLSLITSKLEGDDVREQVKKINGQINSCITVTSLIMEIFSTNPDS